MKLDPSLVLAIQAEDALLAVGPLVASHFGARFDLLAWTGAGILETGEPQILLLSIPVPVLVALCSMPWIDDTLLQCLPW